MANRNSLHCAMMMLKPKYVNFLEYYA